MEVIFFTTQEEQLSIMDEYIGKGYNIDSVNYTDINNYIIVSNNNFTLEQRISELENAMNIMLLGGI